MSAAYRETVDRRLAGAALLLLAAVALLIAPGVSGPGIDGQPQVAPAPEPPAIGACLLDPDVGAIVVPCAEPHRAEVTSRWPADDLPDPVFRTDVACGRAGAGYASLAAVALPGSWLPAAGPDHRFVAAPPEQRWGSSAGWSICVVEPGPGFTYTGSIRGIKDLGNRPDLVGRCFDGRPSDAADCVTPHTGETLAATIGSFYRSGLDADTIPDPVMDALYADCATVAAILTGAPDPTYGGQLQLITSAEITHDPWERFLPIYYSATCTLEAPGSQHLTHSLLSWADNPLPLT